MVLLFGVSLIVYWVKDFVKLDNGCVRIYICILFYFGRKLVMMLCWMLVGIIV